MNVGAGLSTLSDPGAAATEAGGQAVTALGGERASLAVVFASPHHASGAQEVVDSVQDAANPAGLIGCVAEAVVGGGREVEREPAVSVWLGALPGRVETFHMEFVRTGSGGVFAGWQFADVAGGAVLMVCDPFSPRPTYCFST